MHLDSHGIIVQSDGDDGDSLHRMATLGIGQFLLMNAKNPAKPMGDMHSTYVKMVTHLYNGVEWRRGTTKWNEWGKVSRDQMVPVIIFLGLYSSFFDDYKVLNQTLDKLQKDFYKVGNGDTFLTHLSVILRAKEKLTKWDKFFLHLVDIQDLIGTLIHCFVPFRWHDGHKKFEKVGLDQVDDWNGFLTMVQAYVIYETTISKLSRFIYRKFRPKSHGLVAVEPKGHLVKAALMWYNRAESGGNPELLHPFNEILDSEFSP